MVAFHLSLIYPLGLLALFFLGGRSLFAGKGQSDDLDSGSLFALGELGISIIIPARNEEKSIGDCLDAIRSADLARHFSSFEVLVVDDDSSDGTATIASAKGAKVISSTELPPSWIGKNFACHLGSEATSNPIMVFLDADVRIQSGVLRLISDVVEAKVDLYSVQPFHFCFTLGESFALFFNLVALLSSGAISFFKSKRPKAIFGPVLITTRESYSKSGGHAEVHDQIVEDVALAQLYQEAGLAIGVTSSRKVAWFRMYPDGFSSMVAGFTKNFAKGARSVAGLSFLATFVVITMWLYPIPQLFFSSGRQGFFIAIGGYLFGAVTVWIASREIGRYSSVLFFLYPIALFVFLWVLVRSGFKVIFGGEVSWKGRSLQR
ncbi:4,4'-diaponeurosporenoate glycosyltransferase [Acidithrix ferrooxidans]|uniref:4,4'-diaponeurosporenoate glycosyltransferase n=1 Tax=Acidithrix ferrooxidans TaxID=1280514 RepID=A0A0D8HK19_9ACTN|nr:4,4'-diaponeurosporenoate glycosyltransferase [Acidithrix ferrooxidans]